MIYVGYQGIGKSSLGGTDKYIDLESSNFKHEDDWYKTYCDVAISLSKQGYDVFISSHKEVREELKKRKHFFKVICPSLKLKEEWIKRLKKRYDETQLKKDYRALENAKSMYDENIKDLLKEDDVIEIENMNYNLENLLKIRHSIISNCSMVSVSGKNFHCPHCNANVFIHYDDDTFVCHGCEAEYQGVQ